MFPLQVERFDLFQFKPFQRLGHPVADALCIALAAAYVLAPLADPLVYAACVQRQGAVFQQSRLSRRFVAELPVHRLHVKGRRGRAVIQCRRAVDHRPRAVRLKGHHPGVLSHQCRDRRVLFAHAQLVQVGKIIRAGLAGVVPYAGIYGSVASVAIQENAGVCAAVVEF